MGRKVYHCLVSFGRSRLFSQTESTPCSLTMPESLPLPVPSNASRNPRLPFNISVVFGWKMPAHICAPSNPFIKFRECDADRTTAQKASPRPRLLGGQQQATTSHRSRAAAAAAPPLNPAILCSADCFARSPCFSDTMAAKKGRTPSVAGFSFQERQATGRRDCCHRKRLENLVATGRTEGGEALGTATLQHK